MMMRWMGLAALGLTLGCQMAPVLSAATPATTAATRARSVSAQVLTPEALPASVVTAVLPQAQRAADDASRRRGIDFFQLHDNPIGLQVKAGTDTAHVVSFLGTSKDRNDLNVELRTVSGSTGEPAIVMNYSGPVTLGRAEKAQATASRVTRTNGLRVDLLTGLPGNGVSDAYGDYLDHWAVRLQQRFSARPFQFDDTPLVFALTRSGEPVAYVFCNQGSRLVLGERKYADVQAVTALAPNGDWLGGYTLVGFNAKTANAGKNPVYRLETDDRFGTLAQFGELP
jgi:hypothetical protein